MASSDAFSKASRSADIDLTLEKPPATYKSAVWQHFGFPVTHDNDVKTVDRQVTVCRLCTTRIKYTGNTTNMSTHLRRHHRDVDTSITMTATKLKPERGNTASQSSIKTSGSFSWQLKLAEVFSLRQKLGATSDRARSITRSIGLFMALDMRPYSVVDNDGFQRMIEVLEPRYKIPSRTHFSNTVVPSLYEELKMSVAQGLKNAHFIALTTDGWTSRATESFITVTAHYITEDWKFENPVLQTRPCHESHTSAHLGEILKGAVEEWKLQRPGVTIPISTDNASNIVNAVRDTA